MTVAVNRLANGTIELTITVPWTDIQTTYNQVVEKFVAETELPGFRKGKAPKEAVEAKLDKSKIYEEVLKQIVPKAYADAIKNENIIPIISPRIEVIAAAENKDWQFKALTCEKPEVKLGDYQTEIGKLKSRPKIWTPGSTAQPANEQKPKVELEQILKVLFNASEIKVPDLLIEDESNRMLSRLIDQTQKLGMTVEQYLLSQGKTSESLRAEYANLAKENLALEFILDAIANQENIKVEGAEIEKIIQETKDPKEQESLINQKPYLSMLLRKQKTLSHLDKLAQPIV